MNLFRVIVGMLVLLLGFSCSDNKEKTKPTLSEDYKRVYKDSFEGDTIQPFWRTNQIVAPSRLQIVEDPSNAKNKVLKISLETGDSVAKGFRNEIVIHSKDSFGYFNKYSYRFMFPKSFFQKEKKKGIIVLNQWHDEPYPGFSWKNKAIKVKPPMAMYVEHTPDGKFKMVLHSGVRMGDVDEMTLVRWKDDLKPDMWYTFECEIFWSLYEDGYVKASINDICFELDGTEQCKFPATNMYHKRPNYYKMGLYWSGWQEHNRFIYYDDFKMTTERVSYFPPVRKKEIK
jgi:hypothetical protein